MCLCVCVLCVSCVCVLSVCLVFKACVCVSEDMCLSLCVCLCDVCLCDVCLCRVCVGMSVCVSVCAAVFVCRCLCGSDSIYLCPSMPFYVSFLSVESTYRLVQSVSCTFVLSSTCFESTISSLFFPFHSSPDFISVHHLNHDQCTFISQHLLFIYYFQQRKSNMLFCALGPPVV